MVNGRRMLCLKDVSCGRVEGATSAHGPGSSTCAELIAHQTCYRIMELFLCGHSVFNMPRARTLFLGVGLCLVGCGVLATYPGGSLPTR